MKYRINRKRLIQSAFASGDINDGVGGIEEREEEEEEEGREEGEKEVEVEEEEGDRE